MQTTTIQKLNQLNQTMYENVAIEFDQSRATSWPGWERIVPYFKSSNSQPLSVLDVGCGNGRFGTFVREQLKETRVDYSGVDSSEKLLELARAKLVQPAGKTTLINLDIVDQLLKQQPLIADQRFDLVVAFGLFHHLPSFTIRSACLQQLVGQTKIGGILVITFWQFLNSLKQREHIVKPRSVGVLPEELEENDYILDWRAGRVTHRYCHYTNNEEEVALLKQTKLKVIDEFFADGSTHNLNHYLVLKKS